MLSQWKSTQRYRASYGRYLEELRRGDVYEIAPAAHHDSDNITRAMTMNAHPRHCDAARAKRRSEPLVNSDHPRVVLGMTVNDVSAKPSQTSLEGNSDAQSIRRHAYAGRGAGDANRAAPPGHRHDVTRGLTRTSETWNSKHVLIANRGTCPEN